MPQLNSVACRVETNKVFRMFLQIDSSVTIDTIQLSKKKKESKINLPGCTLSSHYKI